MDRNQSHNSNYNDDAIDNTEFYYIGDYTGFAICRKRFSTPDEAKKYYQKCMKKVNYECWIFKRQFNIPVLQIDTP